MSDILLVFILGTFLAYYAYFRFSRRRMYKLAAEIPGSLDYPLIGAPQIFLGKTSAENIFHAINDLPESPLKFWQGPILFVIVDQPQDVQIVLNSQHCLDKPMMYDFLHCYRGVLTEVNADRWRPLRKALNPTFSPNVMNSYVLNINRKSRALVKKFDQYVGKGEWNMEHSMPIFAFDAVCTTIIGLDDDMYADIMKLDLHKFFDDLDRMMTLVGERVHSPWFYAEPLYQMSKKYTQSVQQFNALYEMSWKMISSLQKKQSLKLKTEVNPSAITTYIDVIQELTAAGQLPAHDFKDHVDTILVAGVETTGAELQAFLLMVAIHQDVQERLYQEVVNACPDPDADINSTDLSNMPYLDMAFKETLRLYPIAQAIGRIATEDIELNSCTIPKGSNVIVQICKPQRSPKYWGADADKFNPDHFLPEKVKERHPYAYVPFSAGPRNCLGLKFATVIMKIAMAHLLRNFHIRTPLKMEEVRMKVTFTLKIANDPIIVLERRKQ